MNGTQIEPISSVKYLGVMLDNKLNFSEHIRHSVKKANKAKALLYNLINRKSDLNLRNKLILFKAIIRPTMMYAAPVWSSTYITNIKKLQVIQNKALRMITNAKPRARNINIHTLCNIEEIKTHLYTLTENFFKHQINNLKLLENIGKYNNSNAPFKIKYKLPHHILMT